MQHLLRDEAPAPVDCAAVEAERVAGLLHSVLAGPARPVLVEGDGLSLQVPFQVLAVDMNIFMFYIIKRG